MKPELPLYARLLAAAVFGAGAFYLVAPLLGFDFGGEIAAPRWMALLAATFFALCAIVMGFGLFVTGERLSTAPLAFRIASHASVLAFLALLAVAFTWLALSPDAAPFSASMSAAGEVRGEAPESEARLAFGGLAVLSYILIIAALWRAWRN